MQGYPSVTRGDGKSPSANGRITCDATRPVHFTAPINAFSASSDGQQQRSPLREDNIEQAVILLI
jgi:hypothetical protein